MKAAGRYIFAWRVTYKVGVESKVRISKMLIFQEKQKTSAYLQFYCFLCQISHAPDQYDLNYYVTYFQNRNWFFAL